MTLQYYLMANYTIFRKLLMKRLASTGLTISQPKILDYLYRNNGANQVEIAAACYMEAASLSSALNGMEAKGLIERRRLEGDRRSYYIFLTEKGMEMAQLVEKAFSELEELLLLQIPDSISDHITEELASVYETLDVMLREETRE